MKKQLLILAGTIIVIFFSIQFASAAKFEAAVSSGETNRPAAAKNDFSNTAAFSLPVTTNPHYTNNMLAEPDKGSKPGLFNGLMSLTSIPLFVSPGNIKKTAFLTIANEKVLLGSPSHSRFSYPAIAFRIRF